MSCNVFYSVDSRGDDVVAQATGLAQDAHHFLPDSGVRQKTHVPVHAKALKIHWHVAAHQSPLADQTIKSVLDLVLVQKKEKHLTDIVAD